MSNDNSLSLANLFKKETEIKTPLLLKVVVVIQIWFLLGSFIQIITKVPAGSSMIGSLIFLILQAATLKAIWNLRRWGVVMFIVLALISLLFGIYSLHVSSIVIRALIIFRGITIIPALLYWRRMT